MRANVLCITFIVLLLSATNCSQLIHKPPEAISEITQKDGATIEDLTDTGEQLFPDIPRQVQHSNDADGLQPPAYQTGDYLTGAMASAMTHALSVQSPDLSIEGKIHDNFGRPVEGAYVACYDANWTRIQAASSGQDGSYRISVPALDSYIVQARSPDVKQGDLYILPYYALPREIARTASSLRADFTVFEVGNIVILSYDSEGRLLRAGMADLHQRYTTDLTGIVSLAAYRPLHDSYSASNNWDSNLAFPAFLIPINQPRVIDLLWEVPGFGKILLKADNDGRGFLVTRAGQAISINLNYELAKTQLRLVEEYVKTYSSGFMISRELLSQISNARNYLQLAAFTLDESQRAIASDKSLRESLYAGEQLEYEKAKFDIEQYRKTGVTLRLLDEKGNAMQGVKVRYQQSTHDFLFGIQNWPFDEKAYSLMKDAGINYVSILSSWITNQPTPGNYRWDYLEKSQNIRRIIGMGFASIKITPYVYFKPNHIPSYVFQLNFEQLKGAVRDYVRTFVSQYKDLVKYWDVNEPEYKWAQGLGLSQDQMIEICDLVRRTIRDVDPDAVFLVNYTMPEGQWVASRYSFDSYLYIYMPYEFESAWEAKAPGPDVIGLQFYSGPMIQPGGFAHHNLFTVSRLLDWYSTFQRPIHITELGFASSQPSSYDWRYGWWHNTTNEDVQAEWLLKFYTIAFSKPYVKAITWWDALDKNAFLCGGGLLRSDYKPRPSYEALKTLISSWTTAGSTTTNSTGEVSFRGFAGDYEIYVDGYETAKFHLTEGKSDTIVLKLTTTGPFNSIAISYIAVGIVTSVAILLIAKLVKSRRIRGRRGEAAS